METVNAMALSGKSLRRMHLNLCGISGIVKISSWQRIPLDDPWMNEDLLRWQAF